MSKKQGVSLRSVDAIDVGLFTSGPARIKESLFSPYTYKGSNKPVDVWLVVYSRPGEEDYEQPYGIGKNWKIGDDGKTLIPKGGQTGLPKTCNAMMYLVKPLEKALTKAKLDPDDFLSGDPTALEGLDVIVSRIDQEKRDNQKERADGSARSILIIEKVEGVGKKSKGGTKAKGKADADDDDEEEEETPKAKGKGKTKPAADDDDDDEEDDDDDDEEDEKPVAKAKGKKKPAADDDDDDDDEDTPKAKAGAKGKTKPKPAAADDDESDEDDLLEEGTEALIAALETADAPIALDDLGAALRAELKGNPKRKAIAAFMEDPDVLANEKGWSYNAKKKIVTLD